MKKALAAALLAGCANTGDLLNYGHRFDFDAARAPRVTALCITRNAEAHPLTRGTIASMRDGEKPGSYEVVVSLPLLGNTDSIILVEPKGQGSAVKVYTYPGDKQTYASTADGYMLGCE